MNLLSSENLGVNVPRRHGKLGQKLAKSFNRLTGWKTTGTIPDITQAVVIGVPHTSNFDGVFALPLLIALDIKLSILGKKELFDVPILSQFLTWSGVIPIDRSKKGSVLQSSLDKFATGEPLFLGLSPEGTRGYTTTWKTGFYYLAVGANVPIIAASLDYAKKELRFLPPFYPTGDIDADLPQIYALFKDVHPKHPKRLSQPLQDLFL